MHVSLTPQLEELVKNKVASGMYNNASASFLINGADKQARGASALYGEL